MFRRDPQDDDEVFHDPGLILVLTNQHGAVMRRASIHCERGATFAIGRQAIENADFAADIDQQCMTERHSCASRYAPDFLHLFRSIAFQLGQEPQRAIHKVFNRRAWRPGFGISKTRFVRDGTTQYLRVSLDLVTAGPSKLLAARNWWSLDIDQSHTSARRNFHLMNYL
ncbi:hypothetical protein NA2_20644 [Nitratireductor pacificus pht-3B]|uniref:Uncharacterized protein n=1 Tax=Nitratireductor pacificus pht-3B TaxID=391937 RepID=K2MID7_9HYPH|nr:hypothetical protein NA2_20644 [Nitratireductor pacificus pht-3B]